MAFYKTASIQAVGVYQSSGKFVKKAAKFADLNQNEDKLVQRSINLISPGILNAVASVYNLSNDINNYILPVYRAVTADVPNNNGDCFDHEELIRFSPPHRCQVYRTFQNDPFHIEHQASDPKSARGFLPDVHYATNVPKDKHILVVAAIDVNKDMPLAEGIIKGELTDCSMGCVCEAVKCSYSKCASPIAYSDNELCEHLRWHKMAHIDGELIFERCLGVEYQELSQVGEGADPNAKQRGLLKYEANLKKRNQTAEQFAPIASLLSKQDQIEVARYFRENLGKLPESVVRLVNKLY